MSNRSSDVPSEDEPGRLPWLSRTWRKIATRRTDQPAKPNNAPEAYDSVEIFDAVLTVYEHTRTVDWTETLTVVSSVDWGDPLTFIVLGVLALVLIGGTVAAVLRR